MTRSESDRQTKCCIICMYWKHRTVCSIFACLCTFFYAIATSIQTFYLYYVCFFFFLFSFCCYCFHLFCFTSLFPQFTWKQHRYRYYCHNFINIKLYKRYTHTHTILCILQFIWIMSINEKCLRIGTPQFLLHIKINKNKLLIIDKWMRARNKCNMYVADWMEVWLCFKLWLHFTMQIDSICFHSIARIDCSLSVLSKFVPNRISMPK